LPKAATSVAARAGTAGDATHRHEMSRNTDIIPVLRYFYSDGLGSTGRWCIST
jgi:hypothetical protein